MLKKTALHDAHLKSGAKMVDFGGWEMPIHYGSQVEEHHQVRQSAGMFDVSHMTVVDIEGADSLAYLRKLLANDVNKLKTQGAALYTCMLNESGGIIDDLIVYYMDENHYRLIVNSATRQVDLQWLKTQNQNFQIKVSERPDLAMIAVQGPEAVTHLQSTLPEYARLLADQSRFSARMIEDYFCARTGYTGEDGFEIVLPETQAVALWGDLESSGVKPCGLGARDTLRLEAGLNLYGQDMDQSTSPLVSALAWTIAWEPEDRNFIGRASLEQEKKAQAESQLVGLILLDRGVFRHGQIVKTNLGNGLVTSGSFSPTLGKSIAMARLPRECDAEVVVEIRGKTYRAAIVKMPFVRNGAMSKTIQTFLETLN